MVMLVEVMMSSGKNFGSPVCCSRSVIVIVLSVAWMNLSMDLSIGPVMNRSEKLMEVERTPHAIEVLPYEVRA